MCLPKKYINHRYNEQQISNASYTNTSLMIFTITCGDICNGKVTFLLRNILSTELLTALLFDLQQNQNKG